MEGLEDAWPRFYYYLHAHGHSMSFFTYTRIFVAMTTLLVKDILHNVWICEADCNKVYMNKTYSLLLPLTS